MDDYLHGFLQEMGIDDEGARWEAGSDHNLIELRFDIQKARAHKQEEGVKWKINDSTEWVKFRKTLERKLQQWTDSVGKLELRDKEEMYEMICDNLIWVIKNTAESTVGRQTVQRKRFRGKIRGLQKRRNRAAKKWRQASKGNSEDTMSKWMKYLKLSRKLKTHKMKRKDQICRSKIKDIMEDNKGNVSKMWQQLRFKSTH